MPLSIQITGAGAVSPFGDSIGALHDGLITGRTGIAADGRFATAGCRSTLAARVAGFDAAKWVPPMKLRRMDATGPLALAMTQQAIAQARYQVGSGDDRTGVVLGTYTAGGTSTSEYMEALFSGGPANAPALLFNSTVGNAATGLAGLEFKLRGPNATLGHKEASGLAAIVTAVDLLRAGRADAIVAGGVDAIYDIFYKAHDRFGVMNPGASFDESAAPFGARHAGFVLGEGAYGLWLERSDGWRARGASCLGEILGVGASSTAVPLNAWPDRPGPLVRTMQMALDDAGVSTTDVDVVYASANASRGLDDVEAAALVDLFGDARPIVTSVKGALGESGASGAATCVAALLCGARDEVPPIAGLADMSPAAADLALASAVVRGPARTALINSFASGGALFSAVLRSGI